MRDVCAGDRDQGKPSRYQDREQDADQTAPTNVMFVTAIHAEVYARRTGCREEPDNDLDHHREAHVRGGMDRRVIKSASDISEEDDQNHQQGNEVKEQGELGDVLNPLGADIAESESPDRRDDAEDGASRSRF